MFISRLGAQIGDVVEDHDRGEWVLIGTYHDIVALRQVHMLVRRATRLKMFARVKVLADEEFDEFQYDYLPTAR